MKFSEKWLREWVNPNLDSNALASALTMAGLEVEAILPVANPFNYVVIGKILEMTQHPNADRLKVCAVDVGQESPLTIVCGATNPRPGMKVPVALIGATLSPTFTIQKTKLRGIDSSGMICSNSELGLTEKSEGILELPDDAPIGQEIKKYLDLDDHIFELKLTPNRGDCLSIAGVAREVAAITENKICAPVLQKIPDGKNFEFPIKITATEACPRYLGRVIKSVNVKAVTPLWLKEKLRRSNIRSINPIVDITNYVMLECGQPMHAFDLNKLANEIDVRYAKKSEKLKLLNEQEINLDEKTLVIADANQPVALAGVMGGAATGVNDHTKDIFLESAYFNSNAIWYSTKKYNLNSDASQRFERGVDPQLAEYALQRATELVLQIAGGEPGKIVAVTAEKWLPKNPEILLRKDRIKRILGVNISAAEVENIFKRLHMEIKNTDQGWRIIAPSYRFDIQTEIDLIEELARIYGYQKIPTHLPIATLHTKIISESFVNLKRIRDLLMARDYSEVMTYSFVSTKLQNLFDPQHSAKVLLNPISSDMSVMRTNLWPGLMQAMLYNLNRQETRMRLFETGLCFVQTGKELKQIPRLAGIVVGQVHPEQWGAAPKHADFFDVKSDVEALLSLSGNLPFCSFRAGTHPALKPNESADIYFNEELVGQIGQLHPAIMEKLDIKSPVILFELDLSCIQQGKLPQFKALSKFPLVRRDIAIIVAQSISADEIQQEISNITNQLLKNVKIFDIYQGKGIEPGKKSVALGLLFQHYERTLTDAEVNQEVEQIVSALQQKFAAKLRE